MESPFDIIKNIGKNIVKTGKQAVTEAFSGTGAFAPETSLGIARNTITGLPKALGTIKTTASEFIAPKRGFELDTFMDYTKNLVSAKTPAEKLAVEQKWKSQQPTFKEAVTTLPRYGAELTSTIGSLAGTTLADKPLYTKESLLGRIAPSGAGKTLADVASTKLGAKLATAGGAVEQYAIPKTSGEAQSMRLADILSFFPMGTAKAVTKLPQAIKLARNTAVFDHLPIIEKALNEANLVGKNLDMDAIAMIEKIKKYNFNDLTDNDVKGIYEILARNGRQDIVESISKQISEAPELQPVRPSKIELAEQAKAIVKDGKKVVIEAPQPRDIIGRFDVKPKPTLSEELMGKMKPTSKVDDVLLQEARKYKTAEEFVKAQGEPLYHGTTARGREGISKKGFKLQNSRDSFNQGTGISITTDTKIASKFTGKDGEVLDVVLDPKAKLFDGDEFKSLVRKEYNGNQLRGEILAEDKVVKKLKSEGYDGIDYRGRKASESYESEIRIWNTEKLKTKSQLTDIWNKANKNGIKGGQEAFGAVAGVEVDEEGNVKFDPLKAGLGFAGFTAYNKMKKFRVFDKSKRLLGEVDAKDFYSAETKAKEVFGNDYNSLMTKPDKVLMPVDRLIAEGKIKINRVGTRDVYSYKKGNMWQRARDESSAIRAVTKEPKLKPSLPENLVEKKIAVEIQKEAIKDSPLNSLIKYTAKTGENKGRLPEVLGGAGTKGFAKKGDDIVTEALGRNVDSETARQQLETFMQRKQQVLAQEKAVNEEIKAFRASQKEVQPKVTPKTEAPRPSSPVQAITGTTGEVRSLEKMAEQSATKEILDPQLRKSSSLPKIIEKTATNVKNKVNALDYFRTPDKVLKKIGLENNAIEIRRGYDAYVKELPKNINKITEWSKRVSKEGNVKIFKYLDGEAIDLNPEELKVANEIKTWLAQWANRLGLPQDNRIANYITHLFDDQLIAKEFDEDLAKIIADKVPSSVYDPFLLKRLGAKGYKQDTWAALDAYVKRGTRKVHMDAPLANLEDASRRLEESQWNYVKRFADRVNMRPTEFDNIIDNGIKSLIGYRFGQRPVTTIARTLRQATYRGMLGLNVGSALRNLSQGINTYAKLGEKYTVVGYSKLFSPKNLAELAEEGVLSPGFIQDRAMSSTKKFMEKADKVLFALFDTAEKINRGAAYFGAKAKGVAEGMSEAKAIEYAKKIVRDTQFAFGSIDTPVGMSSDIVKTLTQFQTFTTKQIEFLSEMAKNKEYAGLIRYALSGLAFVYTVGQAFGMEPKDLIPVYRLGTPPSLKLPWEGVKAIAGAKDKYGGERTTGEKITDVAETLPGYIPAGIQAKKTIQGAKAIQEGGVFDRANRMQFEGPETKAQQIQAILFGKYASEKAKSYFDKAEGKELEKIKPVYDQVQKLKEMGDMDGGQAIIDSLTDEEYEMYKKVKSSETTKKNAEIKKSMYPVYNDVQKLKTAGKTAEAQKIIDGLTDDEYKAYQSIKKDKESKPTTPKYDQNIVLRYVEAVVKDPSNALKALFTKEKLGKVEGNLVELQRFYGVPFTDVGGSQEYKKKRMTEMGLDWDTEKGNYKLEHIVPVSAGGSNADSNLVPVNNTEHDLYTPIDIALGEAVKQGKITRKRATELARGLKVTKILSIEDIIKLLE